MRKFTSLFLRVVCENLVEQIISSITCTIEFQNKLTFVGFKNA